MDDELGAAGQGLGRGGVHVADDHVGPEALLAQRVGPAVDPDEHRLDVADVGPQGAQVAAVVDPAHDDQARPVAEGGLEARQLDLAGQQLALLDHVLDGVASERVERLADLAARRVVAVADLRGVLHAALGDQLLAAPDPAAAHLDAVAVAQALEEAVVGQVDEVDAGLDDEQRPEVGIGAARRRAAVEDRAHADGDEVLGRDAVEVLVVDDRDVAGREVLGEDLSAPAEPRGAGDRALRDTGALVGGGTGRRARHGGHGGRVYAGARTSPPSRPPSGPRPSRPACRAFRAARAGGPPSRVESPRPW